LGSGTPAGDPSRLRRISPRSTAFRYRGPEVQAWRKALTSAGLNSGPISSHSLGPIAIASGTGGYLNTRGNASKSRREIVFNLPWRRAALSSRWARFGGGVYRAFGGLCKVANLAAERFAPAVLVPICFPLSSPDSGPFPAQKQTRDRRVPRDDEGNCRSCRTGKAFFIDEYLPAAACMFDRVSGARRSE
jgi:hypothetical protein